MTQIFLNSLPVFLLIFCRVTALFVIAPIFSNKNVPTMFKIGLGFFISFVIFTVQGDIQPTINVDEAYILLVIKEVLIGIMLGYIVLVFFTVMQAAGGIIDLQIGFAMANILDPQTGASVSLTGNFKYMLVMICFLTMNGHHLLITAIMDSFMYMPLDNDWYTKVAEGTLIQVIVEAFAYSMLLGVQIATPVMVALFLTDLGLGFLAKTAPQFNVFVIGFAIKIFVGLALLIVILPGMGQVFEMLFTVMFEYMERIFGIFFVAG